MIENNPYGPTPAIIPEIEFRKSRPRRIFNIIAFSFCIYVILGHIGFYWKVWRAYENLGPSGTRAYFPYCLVILFLSLVGAMCILATFLHTFRKTRMKSVFVVMCLGLAGMLGSVGYFYVTLENYWRVSVVFLFN